MWARRGILRALAATIALGPAATRAQRTGALPLVGVAFGSVETDPEAQERAAAFRQGLHELGWVEGKDLRFAWRWMGNSAERARALAAELVGLQPDVILSSGTVATQALHRATTTIPIVFVNVTDPVAGGFVASLARPGGNVTGFTPFEYPIAGKWLQQLCEIAPGLSRVALMGDPDNHNYRGFRAPFDAVAGRLGVEPLPLPARNADEIEAGIRALASRPGAGLVVSAAIFSLVHRELILGLTAALRLPAIYWTRYFPQTGGLISYGPSSHALHRQSAQYVARILRGERPASLPVQEATRFETVLNLATARALGLTIAPSLVAGVDEVIE